MLPTITMLLSISLFMPGSICFIYLGSSVLDMYILVNIISSCISHFNII